MLLYTYIISYLSKTHCQALINIHSSSSLRLFILKFGVTAAVTFWHAPYWQTLKIAWLWHYSPTTWMANILGNKNMQQLVWNPGQVVTCLENGWNIKNKTQFLFFEISFGTDYITLLCTAYLSHHIVTFCTLHAGKQHRGIKRKKEENSDLSTEL